MDEIRYITATVTEAVATATSSSAPSATTTPVNPLLQYQPNYSRSLVVQAIVLSAVAALHIVLLLHLLFTTKYHLPLARFNYLLLTGGCIVSFAALFWQIVEVANSARDRARQWPFMFDYLQYAFPMPSWEMSRKVIWLVVNAIVVFLCHAAHIHVLTLLYPSKLEKRLFIALLLPLCVVSCALSFAPLLKSQREQDIFDSGAAVCNSTLTLLYTCALAFWGGYIARKRAWGQADESGSTAVFGGCALGMALLGTILSFISISRSADNTENGGWLDRVTWMVLLWQTWFTVWWWIGAGMYGAERPLEDEEIEEDKQSSTARLKSKRKMAEHTIKRYFDENLGGTLRLRHRRSTKKSASTATDGTTSDGGEEAIELTPMRRFGTMASTNSQDSATGRPASVTSSNRPRSPLPASSEARATLDSSESSSNSTNHPPTFINTLVRRIRKAHVRAAKAAHRDMMNTAGQNPEMNDAIIGRRGKGWSVSGIMISRQDNVAKRAASGQRDAYALREDRRVGAARISEDEEEEGNEEDREARRRIVEDTTPWIDEDEAQQQRSPPTSSSAPHRTISTSVQMRSPPTPMTSKRFQNWRRKDVTRYD